MVTNFSIKRFCNDLHLIKQSKDTILKKNNNKLINNSSHPELNTEFLNVLFNRGTLFRFLF